MSNRRTRKRKRHQTERRVLLVAFLASILLVLGVGGGLVYAKYYADSYRKGIAIATGVYFTANYAVEVDTSGETGGTIDESKIIERVVDKVGTDSGVTDSFVFEVRNYENNLLFNESTIEIPYTVSFWLEKDPENGIVYNVTYNKENTDGSDSQKIGGGQATGKITFSGHSIVGGSALANKYTIDVTVPEGVTYEPIPVYVEVKTATGAVVNATLRGKMVMSESKTTTIDIQLEQFVTSNEEAADEVKFAEIRNQSALTYEVRTIGELANDSVTEMKIAWNPNVYEIDLTDDAYLSWLKAQGDTVTAPFEETADRGTDGVKWKYITLEVLPYSSQTVNFFRGAQFGSESYPIANMADLYKYIDAELITVSTSNEVVSE